MNRWIKPFSVTTLLLLSITFTQAQSNRFTLGFEGGPNFTYIRGTEFATTYLKPAMGYNVSGNFQYNFSTHFSLITGLGFTQKSTKLEGNAFNQFNETVGTYDKYYHCFALTTDVALRTYFYSTKRIQYFFDLGVYSVFINEYRTEIILTINGMKQPTNEFDDSPYITSHLGIVGGIGLAYSITSKIGLTGELQNWLGLINYPRKHGITNLETKPNSTGFMIGIYYKLIR